MSLAINDLCFAAPPQGRLMSMVQTAFAGMFRARLERRTVAAFTSLNDATLKDIGVARSDIDWLAADLSQGINRQPPKK